MNDPINDHDRNTIKIVRMLLIFAAFGLGLIMLDKLSQRGPLCIEIRHVIDLTPLVKKES